MDENKTIHADDFCRIYEQYKNRLYRYAYYRLGSSQDAEDAVSECVLSAYRQIGQLRDVQAFPAWIFKILSAVCGKLINQQMERRKTISLDAIASAGCEKIAAVQPAGQEMAAGSAAVNASGLAVQDPADAVVQRMDLQRALEQLSAEEKEIVLLSFVAGFTSREIAQMTGSRPGTVRSRISRSLAKMREQM